jgi:hypothetical protein
MVDERPGDRRLRELFDDITHTTGADTINGDYRTLALWPEYLHAAWRGLKPVIATGLYRAAADDLRARARALTATLPYPVPLSPEHLGDAARERGAALQKTEQFERLLPELVLNMALLKLELAPPERALASPYPPAYRTSGGDLAA